MATVERPGSASYLPLRNRKPLKVASPSLRQRPSSAATNLSTPTIGTSKLSRPTSGREASKTVSRPESPQKPLSHGVGQDTLSIDGTAIIAADSNDNNSDTKDVNQVDGQTRLGSTTKDNSDGIPVTMGDLSRLIWGNFLASECKFRPTRQRDWDELAAKEDIVDKDLSRKDFVRIRNEHTMYNEALARDRLILAARQKAAQK